MRFMYTDVNSYTASGGSAMSPGDRRRLNRRRGETFFPATSVLPLKEGLTPIVSIPSFFGFEPRVLPLRLRDQHRIYGMLP